MLLRDIMDVQKSKPPLNDHELRNDLLVGQGFCYSFDVVFIGNERVVVMRNSPAIEYDDTESWANVDDFLVRCPISVLFSPFCVLRIVYLIKGPGVCLPRQVGAPAEPRKKQGNVLDAADREVAAFTHKFQLKINAKAENVNELERKLDGMRSGPSL
ncbi:hypothetical protein Tco_0824657 [Tanacetum coccineum]|uniref:Uncharacterized protein n=1 Tax=Tanacetum coccineum TaxID=301880 RepID=A0ABQ5AM98_9ASTR